tara:strand:- start:1581 stop:2441 length:861 start_codon:yes stop_codon:yes gene_type:complete
MLKALKKINFILNKKKEVYLIDSDENMDFLIDSLINENLIGLDTEFNWRKTYYPELSLLQISTESKILLIDCLKCKKLDFLKVVLESKEKLIILHSSRSDATVLSTNLKIELKNSFDIQIAEKYISGGDIKNYGSIVIDYFGYKLAKSETNSNWLKRPLTDKQLEYAADDVNFLIPIYKKQLKKLKKINKKKEVLKVSQKEVKLGNQKLHVSRVKKLKKATKDEKAIFLWREKQASIKNLPPSFIFENKSLKEITKAARNKKDQLSRITKLFKDDSSANDFFKFIK